MLRRWKVKDLDVLSRFGFEEDKNFIYPKYMKKQIDEHRNLYVSISEPCINVWDGEDKNHRGQIELVDDKGFSTYDYEEIGPYIEDMIEEGAVELV